MDYFECDVPSGDGRCSDNSCPCPEVIIPRGTGYLYIEQRLVYFRHQYPTLESARRAMQQEHEQQRANLGGGVTGFYRLGPILVCEQGAKLREIDLEVAAADAKHWWETGQVPLRATPRAGTVQKEPIAKATSEAAPTTNAHRSPTVQKKPIAKAPSVEKKWWQFWR